MFPELQWRRKKDGGNAKMNGKMIRIGWQSQKRMKKTDMAGAHKWRITNQRVHVGTPA